ncbi:MAG: polyprenyl synthetase family protein [Clostridia bacterium]|nr:polyprenyl synthetase family protein [Clostridia bacterium]
MDFKTRFNEYILDFEQHIKDYAKSMGGMHPGLYDAMNYSLLSGGKRIRPVIMLAFCDLIGGNKNNVYPFACALEMIHTYSLIHDDLPCMDDDTMRRGKPCNHITFGEDMALLAGDALLTQAFEVASGFETSENLVKNQIRSINILAKCAGSFGMVSGQCFDLHTDKQHLSKNDVINIYRLKTAELFCAASSVGAVMSGADENTIKLAELYGEKLGIAFQLIDDILDDESELLSVFEDETPQKFLRMLTFDAKEILGKIGGDTEFLISLTDYLTGRTY